MLKKTVTYVDFNGQQRTEDFYFNLSKGEIVEMELRENLEGGLKAVLTRVIESNDGRQIMDAFKKIISDSFGIKSADGRSFIKTPQNSAGFLGSEAYSQIFLELVMNPEAASAFINGIVPADMSELANAQGRPVPQDHRPKQTPVATLHSVPEAPVGIRQPVSEYPVQTPPADPSVPIGLSTYQTPTQGADYDGDRSVLPPQPFYQTTGVEQARANKIHESGQYGTEV